MEQWVTERTKMLKLDLVLSKTEDLEQNINVDAPAGNNAFMSTELSPQSPNNHF